MTDTVMNTTSPKVNANDVRDALTDRLVGDILKERISNRRWSLVKRGLWVLAIVLSLVYYVAFVMTSMGYRMMPSSEIVGVVKIHGEISSMGLASAEKVIPALRRAFVAPNVKAVALSIDSPGGAPVEAERIFNAIEQFKKSHPKPVYAFINNLGASAGYMIAIHADQIYAANYSLVGSIGAVISGWDFHKAMEKLNVGQRVYASGALKSLMNPYAAMTPEAEAKASSLVHAMGQRFKQDVIAARGARLTTKADIATGEVWNGAEAKAMGLIDEIGTMDDVIAAKHSIKTFDFGPGKPGIPGLSAISEDFGRGVASFLFEASAIQVR
jgi:protease IV